MPAYVVWIDSHEAKLFKLAPKGVESHHIKAHGHKHPSQPHGKHHEHAPDSGHLFEDTAKALADASEILILGPGEPKSRFKNHLEKQHSTLGKKVVGVETVDHPTDGQIVAVAKKFFRDYDLFHG